MASFIQPQETLEPAIAGSISRHGARTTTRTLNQAGGLGVGLLVGPSGTAGQECASPATAAAVKASVGFSIYRPMSEDADADEGVHYADNEAVGIMEEGHMHVECEGTCVQDRPVLARITSDGGDNTVLGKVSATSDYPAGGITLTPSVANSQAYSVELFDGVVRETYAIVSGGSATAQAIVEALAAAINAGTAFDATEDNSVINITSVTGVLEIQPSHNLAVSNPARCVIVPGCFFDRSRTGAGLVEIRRNKVN